MREAVRFRGHLHSGGSGGKDDGADHVRGDHIKNIVRPGDKSLLQCLRPGITSGAGKVLHKERLLLGFIVAGSCSSWERIR